MLLSEGASTPYSMFPMTKHRGPYTTYITPFKSFIKHRIVHFHVDFSIVSSRQPPSTSQIPTDVSSEQSDEDGKR